MQSLDEHRLITLEDFFQRYSDWNESRLNLCLNVQNSAHLTPEQTFSVVDELEDLEVINRAA